MRDRAPQKRRHGVSDLHKGLCVGAPEEIIVRVGLHPGRFPGGEPPCLGGVDIHVAVKFHVGGDGLADLPFLQLEIFILENAVSPGVGHNVRDLGVVGAVPLAEASKDLNIPVVVVPGLVVRHKRDLPPLVDAGDIGVFKAQGIGLYLTAA